MPIACARMRGGCRRARQVSAGGSARIPRADSIFQRASFDQRGFFRGSAADRTQASEPSASLFRWGARTRRSPADAPWDHARPHVPGSRRNATSERGVRGAECGVGGRRRTRAGELRAARPRRLGCGRLRRTSTPRAPELAAGRQRRPPRARASNFEAGGPLSSARAGVPHTAPRCGALAPVLSPVRCSIEPRARWRRRLAEPPARRARGNAPGVEGCPSPWAQRVGGRRNTGRHLRSGAGDPSGRESLWGRGPFDSGTDAAEGAPCARGQRKDAPHVLLLLL